MEWFPLGTVSGFRRYIISFSRWLWSKIQSLSPWGQWVKAFLALWTSSQLITLQRYSIGNASKRSWCSVVSRFSASHVSYIVTYEVGFSMTFCNISLTEICQDKALTKISISPLGYFTIYYLDEKTPPEHFLVLYFFVFFCALPKKAKEKTFLNFLFVPSSKFSLWWYSLPQIMIITSLTYFLSCSLWFGPLQPRNTFVNEN